MNTINKVGIRMVGITLAITIIAFGLWKGAVFMLNSTSSTAQVTPTPLPTQALLTPTPLVIPSELQQQISSYTKSAEESLGVYTKKYLATLPSDATQAQVLDPKTLEKFIEENRGVLLPKLSKGTVKTSSTSGKNAVQSYLDKISPAQNKEIQPVTGNMITSALEKQISNENPQAMTPVRASIEKNFEIFKSIEVPKEAEGLHTKLLQATRSMIDNTLLLQSMQQDFIGGLIGHKNITALDPVFSDISNQILALEKKYNLK